MICIQKGYTYIGKFSIFVTSRLGYQSQHDLLEIEKEYKKINEDEETITYTKDDGIYIEIILHK